MHFTPTKFGIASKPVSWLSKLKFTASTITVMSMYPLYYVLSVSAINLSKKTILVQNDAVYGRIKGNMMEGESWHCCNIW